MISRLKNLLQSSKKQGGEQAAFLWTAISIEAVTSSNAKKFKQ
jgi:hypothetical protein